MRVFGLGSWARDDNERHFDGSGFQLEKLMGDLSEAYSRRIDIQHRLVYQLLEKEKVVKVLRMWTHYE